MEVVHTSIAILLGIWLGLSALNQVRSLGDRLARYDPFGLLPRWTFFAPNPGTHDHHLIYRYAEADHGSKESGSDLALGPWQQVDELLKGRTVPLLWNPKRRLSKTFSDIVNGMARMRRHGDYFDLISMFSTEYAWLTHMAEKQVPHDAVYQWAIVRTHGKVDMRKLWIVFLSRHHRIDR